MDLQRYLKLPKGPLQSTAAVGGGFRDRFAYYWPVLEGRVLVGGCAGGGGVVVGHAGDGCGVGGGKSGGVWEDESLLLWLIKTTQGKLFTAVPTSVRKWFKISSRLVKQTSICHLKTNTFSIDCAISDQFRIESEPRLINSVHTRCIVKTSGFTRGVCKTRGFYWKFQSFLVEFLENSRSWEIKNPQIIARKVDFSEPYLFLKAPNLDTVELNRIQVRGFPAPLVWGKAWNLLSDILKFPGARKQCAAGWGWVCGGSTGVLGLWFFSSKGVLRGLTVPNIFGGCEKLQACCVHDLTFRQGSRAVSESHPRSVIACGLANKLEKIHSPS